jgi:large subunit ribosomal protein L21
MKTMFAVIKTGGKQYRVATDDVLQVEKIAGNPGDVVEFAEVLVVGGDSPQLGTPTIAGAIVAGEVLEQGRGPKVIAFKKRRRKNSRRKRGHRQEFTRVRITEILTDGKKPSKTPPPRAKKPRPPKPAAEPPEAAAAGQK